MSTQPSQGEREPSVVGIDENDVLFLEWHSITLPVLAIDDRYFVVESAALADELTDSATSPIQAGTIVVDRSGTNAEDKKSGDRIDVRFFVDETHQQLARCRFGQLDSATRENLVRLREMLKLEGVDSTHTSPPTTDAPESQSIEKRNGRPWKSILLAGSVFAACFVAFSTAKPEPKTISLNHAALGTQTLPQQSLSDGRVTELMVNVGDQVNAGDVIARLQLITDNDMADVLADQINDGNRELIILQQRLDELQGAAGIARQKATLDLRYAKAELDEQRARLQKEQAKLRRITPLIVAGNIGKAEVDEINAGIAEIKASIEKESAQLDRLTLITEAADQDILVTPDGVTPMADLKSRITTLRMKVQRLTAQRSKPARQPTENVVVASESGVVQAIHLDVGKSVSQGQPALTLQRVDPAWAVASVDASSATEIEVGQTVSVQLPRDEVVTKGTIKAIGEAPAGEAVPVHVAIEGIDSMVPADKLQPSTPVRITLPIEQPSRLDRWMGDFQEKS